MNERLERLEMIKLAPRHPAIIKEYGIVSLYKDDFDWLIEKTERVEELEHQLLTSKPLYSRRILEEENARLRETLKFYADSMLNGSEARQALAGESK